MNGAESRGTPEKLPCISRIEPKERIFHQPRVEDEGAFMGIRVLIVDDSSTIRRIISRCLERAEVGVTEVLEASDGCEALDLLSKQPVDAVLTDINMPNMNGM